MKILFLLILCSLVMAVVPQTIEASDFGPYGPGKDNKENMVFQPLYYEQIEKYRQKRTMVEKERQEQQAEEKKKLEVQKHIIQRGENLTVLAEQYDTSIKSLVYLNELYNPDYLREGDTLLVLPDDGILHRVRSGESLQDISSRYGVDEGRIRDANALEKDLDLEEGVELVVPGADPPPLHQTVSSEQVVNISSPPFLWPLRGVITSGYGWRGSSFHYGLDIAAPQGTPITAIAGGKVRFSGFKGSYGLKVRLDHGDGWESIYGHNAKAYVMEGEKVTAGQKIAAVGATGNATGPHLHLEILHNGERLNPLPLLEER